MGLAILAMAVQALANGGYAYLVGPMLRSLFGSDNDASLPMGPSLTSAAESLGAFLDNPAPLTVALLIVGAAGAKSLAQFSSKILVELATGSLMQRVRTTIYRGVLRLNPLDPKARNRGDMIARLTGDIQVFERALGDGYIALFREALQIAALVGVALLLDPRMAAMGLFAFPLIAWGIATLGRKLRRRRAATSEAFGAVGNQLERSLSGLSEIQAFGLEQKLVGTFERTNRDVRRHGLAAVATRAASSPINEILAGVALGGTLLYAQDRIAGGTLTADRFISLFTALLLLYRPIKGLSTAHHAIQAGRGAFDRLADLYAHGLTASEPSQRSPMAAPRLELQQIVAGYDAASPVLQNLQLEIAAGERIAIVGPSGSGKSTLGRVLLGQLTPQSGHILLDGHRVDPASHPMAGLCAPVPQQPVLFPGTIHSNVACARENPESADVTNACRAAGVLDFCETLPKGLNTPIGPDGGGLSVGQQQRVCLARALLSPAPILLLDELTASLDGITEELLRTRVLQTLGDRTLVIITHRPSTAAWAEKIWVLDNGRVAAYDQKHHALFQGNPNQAPPISPANS